MNNSDAQIWMFHSCTFLQIWSHKSLVAWAHHVDYLLLLGKKLHCLSDKIGIWTIGVEGEHAYTRPQPWPRWILAWDCCVPVRSRAPGWHWWTVRPVWVLLRRLAVRVQLPVWDQHPVQHQLETERGEVKISAKWKIGDANKWNNLKAMVYYYNSEGISMIMYLLLLSLTWITNYQVL